MYRVGFGDFFLIIMPTPKGDQHILIDCGVFKGTSGTGDLGSIVDAVEDLFQTTGGHLSLVIMTHRHADHIAGFSKAPRFKEFTASMVWMPYCNRMFRHSRQTWRTWPYSSVVEKPQTPPKHWHNSARQTELTTKT
jgi:glyoxylase-like metal-dependent hydrolase (beta-lactamase superfamily II)